MLFLMTLLFIPASAFAAVADTAYKDDAYYIKTHYYELSNSLKDGILAAEKVLSASSFENSEAKKITDKAWDIRTKAWVSSGQIESNLRQTEESLNYKYYKNSYDKLLQIDKSAYSLKDGLYEINKEIKNAKDLEKKYQENNKSCILFWCFGENDTYSGVDSKIQDLESKLKKIESSLSTIKSIQKDTIEKIHKYEIADKNLEIKKLEKLRVQEQDKAKQERLRIEEQNRQELQKQQYEAQRQMQQQQDHAERQLQEQMESKERQRIMEEARTNPVIGGLIDGTLYFYIEPIPSSYYKVPGIHEGVDDIARSLEGNFYGIDVRRTYNENSADLIISWVKDFGSTKLGHAVFKTFVEVELGKNNCFGDWQPYNVSTVKKVMWHEIGHSLGYGHSNDPNNVMYYKTQSQFYKTVEHSFSLEGGQSRWFSFCDAGQVLFGAKSSKDTDGFNAFAIPADNPREFSRNGGSVYLATDGQNCGAKNVISLSKVCNVGSDAYLHFKNNELHTIYITFTMYDQNPGHWPEMTWDQNAFEYDPSYLYKVYNMFH